MTILIPLFPGVGIHPQIIHIHEMLSLQASFSVGCKHSTCSLLSGMQALYLFPSQWDASTLPVPFSVGCKHSTCSLLSGMQALYLFPSQWDASTLPVPFSVGCKHSTCSLLSGMEGSLLLDDRVQQLVVLCRRTAGEMAYG